MSLPEELAERLLSAIIDGTHAPGNALPAEGELAEQYAVSRLTVREAVTSLRVQGIVRIQRGRGTFVNPPAQWTALDPLIRAAAAAPRSSRLVSTSLIEARRLIEVGAIELAASKRTEDDLVQLRGLLGDMREAVHACDVDLFVDADIGFHDTIIRASGNAFIPLMFEPFGRLLVEGRRETSAVAEIRAHALDHHTRILQALEAGSPDRARAAMEEHLQQTAHDLHAHVLGDD
ncbi:FadR family transcriptional regulator [Saccharopolyspora sp. HNM0983]|uniref:FadR family transcriptional regulator n=1 Tax=Saccharopolyspora montiporae TaxID=2781240 RepID=A0A929B5P4_9PSEU|nr:FadR family transcriptional regulator [Saccharopolyspora sp. HNM0983]